MAIHVLVTMRALSQARGKSAAYLDRQVECIRDVFAEILRDVAYRGRTLELDPTSGIANINAI